MVIHCTSGNIADLRTIAPARAIGARGESTIDRNGEDVCLLFTKSEVDDHDNEEELSSLQLLLSSA
jgi:hypothetical protein